MRFRYTARDRAGQPLAGAVTAADEDHARRLLAERGLAPLGLEPLTPGTDGAEPLAAELVEQVIEQIAELQVDRVSLEAGLRAAAEAANDRQLAAALRSMAQQLERGLSLEDAWRHLAPTMPPHLAGLLQAVQRTGGRPDVLLLMTEEYERSRDVRHGLWTALAYPLFTLVGAIVLFAAVQLVVVRGFRRVFDDFGLQLPAMTKLLFWWSDVGVWAVIAFALAISALLLVTWSSLGMARLRQVLASAPLVGVFWLWGGSAQFCRLLSLLLRYELPLPEALALAGNSAQDDLYRRIAVETRQRVERGMSLSQALRETAGVPPSLVPFAAAGERRATLDEALSAAAEMFDERARQRAVALRRALPPMIFVCVLMVTIFTVAGLFLPLVTMISGFM